jgi:hypothetical protein
MGADGASGALFTAAAPLAMLALAGRSAVIAVLSVTIMDAYRRPLT